MNYMTINELDLLDLTLLPQKLYLNSIVSAIKSKRLLVPKTISMNESFLNSSLMNAIYENNSENLTDYIDYTLNDVFQFFKPLITWLIENKVFVIDDTIFNQVKGKQEISCCKLLKEIS